MGLEIYKGIEAALERECREEATRIVNQELEPYKHDMDGAFSADIHRRAFHQFRYAAIDIRTQQLARAVTDDVQAAATARIKQLLGGAK